MTGEKLNSRENTSQKWQYLSYLVNKDFGRWMWQESNDINLNSYLHFYKRTLQQSSCQKVKLYTCITCLSNKATTDAWSYGLLLCLMFISDASHLIA